MDAVFLGNPGAKFEYTRHNAGWLACRAVEERCGIKTSRLRFHAFTAVGELGGKRVFFMRPQTYMNLSGDAAPPRPGFIKYRPSALSSYTTIPRSRRAGSE
jgi:PTH1 family peptidyl-tRNA hydrolase